MKPVLVGTTGATEAFREFIFWLVQELGLRLQSESDVHTLTIPENLGSQFQGRRSWRFTFAEPLANDQSDEVELVTCQSALGKVLLAAARTKASVVHARPAADPQGVHEITSRLFGAYQVEGGHVHLGGCEMEDHPFFRLTFCDPQRPQEIWHQFVGPDGTPVSEELCQQLQLDHVAVCEGRPPRLSGSAQTRLRQAAQTAYSATAADGQLLLETVVWCHFVRGKLTFEIGEATADLTVSGCAQQLVAPPLVCAETGGQGYRVAATDDGVIAPLEAIDICEESGRRALRSELVVCRQSGRRVLRSLTEECPISGERELAEGMQTCQRCGQRVGPWEVSSQVCSVCHHLPRVAADEPRIRRLLAEHPGLQAWKQWRLAETRTVWIAKARSIAQGLLVVVDRETVKPLRLAVRRPFWRGWRPLPPEEWPTLLG